MKRIRFKLVLLVYFCTLSNVLCAQSVCGNCNGTGKCRTCSGSGKVSNGYQYTPNGFITGMNYVTCSSCNGSGTCSSCSGRGTIGQSNSYSSSSSSNSYSDLGLSSSYGFDHTMYFDNNMTVRIQRTSTSWRFTGTKNGYTDFVLDSHYMFSDPKYNTYQFYDNKEGCWSNKKAASGDYRNCIFWSYGSDYNGLNIFVDGKKWYVTNDRSKKEKNDKIIRSVIKLWEK